MHKIILLGIGWLFFSGCKTTSLAQNVALGKPYTFSDKPNYGLSSKDTSFKLLTDGNYASGRFWTSDKTVGWSGKKRVSILIDLQQESFINDVSFNTARGSEGAVFFPTNIFLFISSDDKFYSFAGDLARDSSNREGEYLVKKFTLSNIRKTARYIKLVIVPKGSFIFCDEIEVFGGTRVKTKNARVMPVEHINQKVDSLLAVDQFVRSIEGSENMAVEPGDDIDDRMKRAKSHRFSMLTKKFVSRVTIDSISPWGKLVYPYQPADLQTTSFTMSTTLNGVQYRAYAITNLFKDARKFTCSVEGNTIAGASVEIFIVNHVVGGNDLQQVADPLVPHIQPVNLEAGESAIFLIRTKGLKQGLWKKKIKIRSDSYDSEIALNIHVPEHGLSPDSLSLNAVNWAYFDNPMLSDRKKQAKADLFQHHINTFVIPPQQLPFENNGGAKKYEDYLGNLGPARRVFLFMNVKSDICRSGFKHAKFMTDDWNAQFIKWYQSVVASSLSFGITESQLYVYPFDEVADADIEPFVKFLNWLKSNHPNIKTFATINSEKGVRALIPLLTIAQVSDEKRLLDILPADRKNVWIYSAKPMAQSLSPYLDYRLMGWRAFYHNYHGIGFWNYADYSKGTVRKALLSEFDGYNSNNFSVIYNGPGYSIISSRRWEAFQLGIEDYELLASYARKFGEDSARELAGKVLADVNNLGMADQVREQLLISIEK